MREFINGIDKMQSPVFTCHPPPNALNSLYSYYLVADTAYDFPEYTLRFPCLLFSNLFTAAQHTRVPCATYTLPLRNVRVYVVQQQTTLLCRNGENAVWNRRIGQRIQHPQHAWRDAAWRTPADISAEAHSSGEINLPPSQPTLTLRVGVRSVRH